MSTHNPKERHLAAIMFSDIVGYTALMAENEEAGLRVRVRHRDLLGPLAERYRGAVVDENGDELVLTFSSAVHAVNCALATQEALRDDPELKLKIGIHLGDVIFEGGRVYGDGVNVASRVRPLAKPGGICISDVVQHSVRNQSNIETHVLGTRELKNVPSPVTLYQVTGAPAAPQSVAPPSPTVKLHAFDWRTGAAVLIALVALAVVYFAVDKFVLEPGPDHPSVVREKSIAVLPFDNISPNPEDTYFTDGIHDEILAQLSKIRDLKVISRTSVMGYSGRNRPPLPEIAAALGVANILEGSVRLAGNRVRITTQLIEAESDAHLWTETYDRELTAVNIFAIQSEIAKTVADALRATLSPEEQDRLATVPTENLEAYQAYLLGKQRLANRTTASLAKAFDYFEQAIELDPNFALAYVGLADTFTWQSVWGGFPQQETLAKAQVAVDKALALDDGLGEAYNSLAGILQERRDFEAAESTYLRALELNPNYATAYYWYGDLLLVLGRVEEALAMHRRALALDPLSMNVITILGDDLFQLGQFDEALPWYEKAIEVDPRYATAYFDIALYHSMVLGQLDKAVVWHVKAISLDPGEASFQAGTGLAFLNLGDVGKAKYWIQRSIELGPEVGFPNYAMLLLNLRRKEASSLDFARKTIASFPQMREARAVLRNHELREGRPAEARALYERFSPELLSEDDPIIDSNNYRSAIDLAWVLIRTGERDRADLLLDRSLEYIQTIPRLGFGYGIADVEIYALQGDKQKALSALRQAIDEGWRVHWWYDLKYDPILESLHDEPEFAAIVAEVEAEMATQLERVREMERNGELEPIPEVSAAIQ